MLTQWEAFFQGLRERAFVERGYPVAATVNMTGHLSLYTPFPIGVTYAVPLPFHGPDRGPGEPLPEDWCPEEYLAA